MSSQTSQFDLLKQRRFAPLFWVQFLGAANDNIFKYAFTLLATYSAAQWGDVPAHLAGFVIGALFIAPYLLFSATSGQLADKFDKTWLTRRVKEAEIIIMLVAAMGFAALGGAYGLRQRHPHPKAAAAAVAFGAIDATLAGLMLAALHLRRRTQGRQGEPEVGAGAG